MERERIFLVDKKRVAIIKSNLHTYNVRFVKSGRFMEIKKEYVKTWYIKPKSSRPKKNNSTNNKNSQTRLDF